MPICWWLSREHQSYSVHSTGDHAYACIKIVQIHQVDVEIVQWITKDLDPLVVLDEKSQELILCTLDICSKSDTNTKNQRCR